MNTLKQHKKQINDSLLFVSKVKFINAENLQLAAGRNRRGFPTQLKNLGLILSRDMGAGQTIYGLSKPAADMLGVPQFDIHKVTLGRVQHAIVAQFNTLTAAKELGVISYEFEPQNILRDYRPDVIWVVDDDSRIYVEVELSAKSILDGDLDKFFLKLLSRKTIVIFADEVLLDRYVSAARKYIIEGIPNWQFLNGKWIRFDLIKFDDHAWGQIEFWLHKEYRKSKLSKLFRGIQLGW